MRPLTRISISLVALCAVALVTIFSLTACSKKQSETEEVAIGAIFDITESLAYMGQWSIEGAQIAIEEINGSGGIKGKTLKCIVEDAETKPEKAVAAFQKIINVNKIPVVIGFNGSSEVMACAPIANKTHTVLFSTGGASPLITEAGDYVFRNRLSGDLEVREMAQYAIGKMNIRKVAIFFINNDYGKGYEKYFEKSFKELGGEVEGVDSFEQDQTDFRAQLAKFKGLQGIEAIYLVAYVREGAIILKQSKELGLKVQWLTANAIEGPALLAIAGDAAEGILYTVAYYDPNSKSAEQFNRQYKKKFGRDSEMFAANAYDAVKIIAKILSDTEVVNGEAIKDRLYGIQNYDGAAGLTSFDSNGDVLRPIAIKTVHAGKFEVKLVR